MWAGVLRDYIMGENPNRIAILAACELAVWMPVIPDCLFAAIAAVDIASMKSSRWGRTSWLDSACEIMPEWREAADIADLTANFQPIYDLIRQALRDAGRKTREVWGVEET